MTSAGRVAAIGCAGTSSITAGNSWTAAASETATTDSTGASLAFSAGRSFVVDLDGSVSTCLERGTIKGDLDANDDLEPMRGGFAAPISGGFAGGINGDIGGFAGGMTGDIAGAFADGVGVGVGVEGSVDGEIVGFEGANTADIGALEAGIAGATGGFAGGMTGGFATDATEDMTGGFAGGIAGGFAGGITGDMVAGFAGGADGALLDRMISITRSRSSGEMLAKAEFLIVIPALAQKSINNLLSISSSLARAKIRIFKRESLLGNARPVLPVYLQRQRVMPESHNVHLAPLPEFIFLKRHRLRLSTSQIPLRKLLDVRTTGPLASHSFCDDDVEFRAANPNRHILRA